MINRTKSSYLAKVGAFAALIVMAAFVLNTPWILVAKTTLMHRIADPALLLIGLLGSVLGVRLLRAVGWLGIGWFIPGAMYGAPIMDHAAPELQGFPTLWRLVTIALLCLVLLVSFTLLAPRRSDK